MRVSSDLPVNVQIPGQSNRLLMSQTCTVLAAIWVESGRLQDQVNSVRKHCAGLYDGCLHARLRQIDAERHARYAAASNASLDKPSSPA